MPNIPNEINGVDMEFASGVNKDVTQEMLDAMEAAISSTVNGKTVEKLWVSSAKDSHRCPSRHVSGNGVDISRINGKKISVHYESDSTVKAIVDGLQTAFESAPHRRENFGPTIQKKEGRDYPVNGHQDHFHWSVNGDHSVCSTRFLDKMSSWLKNSTQSTAEAEEICDK